MGQQIPFLRPRVVPLEAYAPYIEHIDASHIYSNNGPLSQQFERRLIEELFTPDDAAVTLSNATVGLMLSMAATRRPGARYAVMPSFTFAATPLAAQWAGLTPYFIDVDERSWTAAPEKVLNAVAELGDEVAVVVPYATFGSNMDLRPYERLHAAGIPVVVDAAASLGCDNGGANFGFGAPFPIVFSMHATKSFPIGEGGVVVSADHELIDKIRRGANFGFGSNRRAEWSGFNAKLPEIMCAIALATLESFGQRIAVRRALDQVYRIEFGRHDPVGNWTLQLQAGAVSPQFFSALVPLGDSRADVLSRLAAEGIEARTYFSPACHEQPAFCECPSGDLRITESLSERVISLPLWEGMAEKDVYRCVGALTR